MTNTLFQAIQDALAAHSGSMFEDLIASPHRTIASLAAESSSSGVIILYSANGVPLKVSSLSDPTAIESAIHLGQQGVVATYRTIETSQEVADVLVGLMGDLFRLPLGSMGNGASATPAKRGPKPGSTKKGKPGRPKGSGAKAKRGRPVMVVIVDGMLETSEALPKKKRGRPRKNTIVDDVAPAIKKRGRPRKNAVVGEDTTPTPAKRRGRPKKLVAVDVTAAAPKRRGRPRKNPVVGDDTTAAPPKRRGRPKKVVAVDVAAPAKKKRGRPRKNPV